MLKSIIATALRNILRNKAFSIINLIGLSVSMSLGLLIILIVNEQYSFDNFHDGERIYRVNTTAIRVDGEDESYASTPLPIGRVLQDEYTFVEEVVRIRGRLYSDAITQNSNVSVQGFFADASLLTVFNFPLEKGNPATALSELNGVVLTHETAKKIFGDADPLGQAIKLDNYGEFTVTGVLRKFPGKTHLQFDVLCSLAKLAALDKELNRTSTVDDWNNYYTGYVYFKMKEGRSAAEAERALETIAAKYYAGLKLEPRDEGYEFWLNALADITPGPALSNQMGTGMPGILILFLAMLSGIVMVMACFNYTNLMIAKSLARAREIGVRKVVGANRWQVFIQFIGESTVFSLVALILSYLLLQVLKPAITELYFAREFPMDLNEDPVVYLYFIAFAAVAGVLAGLLPALYLSAFRAARVLKDAGNLKIYSRLTLRKALIVTQFALSVVFTMIILVVNRQANFMVSKDYNFNEEGIYNVYLQGMDFQKLANEVRNIPGVVSVGGVSHALGTYADRYGAYRRNFEDENFQIRDFHVDDNYIANLELTFLAGRNFDPALQGVLERHVILNETALPKFGFGDPQSAIGQAIYANDSIMLTVVGVVKDFNFRPLNYEVGPLALRYNLKRLDILSAKIQPAHLSKAIAAITSTWKKLDPIHAFDGTTMKDQIDNAYWNGGFLDIIKIVGYISALAITMACLGILGMSMYATQTRMKEIGIRKVMGASVNQIIILVGKSFFMLIVIGIVVGFPIGYLLGVAFVEDFAYQIEITPWLMLSGIAVVTCLGLIAISTQTWKAASADPVKTLRYE